jgi:hypothetical protein
MGTLKKNCSFSSYGFINTKFKSDIDCHQKRFSFRRFLFAAPNLLLIDVTKL